MRAALFLIFFLAAASGLCAQTWTHGTSDSGNLVYAWATTKQGLTLACNGPSTGGLDAMSAGSHEDTRVPRNMLMIEIGPDRIPVGTAFQLNTIVIWLDQTGYQLPATNWNELTGVWEVMVPSSDPMIAALRRAKSLIIAPGADVPWQFQTDGLATTMDQSLAVCEAAWSGSGTAPASTLTSTAHVDAVRICNGPYVAEPGAMTEALIDQDAVPDLVVKWEAISCPGQALRPLCGASHCSVWVYLSTRGAVYDSMLAQGVELTPLSNGRTGLTLFGRFDSCGINSLGCARLWYWTGTDFAESPG